MALLITRVWALAHPTPDEQKLHFLVPKVHVGHFKTCIKQVSMLWGYPKLGKKRQNNTKVSCSQPCVWTIG